MARLTLTTPPSAGGDEAAADMAWMHVLNGIRRALAVPNLPSPDEQALHRCYRSAAAAARQPLLGLQIGEDA